MVLRPAAFVMAALAALTLGRGDFAAHKIVWALFLGLVLLTLLHLVPLPFELWSKLPGREIIVAIDRNAGLGETSRPLSMSPDATLNALFSLGVPLAVLMLAVQLDEAGHRQVLMALLALAALSGAVGLLQAAGSDIAFYPMQSETPGLFANRNHQGTLLAMIVPLAAANAVLAARRGTGRRVWTLLGAGLAVVTVPLVVITGSRSGLVAFVIALVLGGLIWGWREREALRARSRWALAPLTIIGVILGLVALTIIAARDIAIERLRAGEGDLRWTVWQSVVDMLPSYLPWGTGIGSYAEIYQVLEPDAMLRPTISNHAHNEFLEIAFTAGIPGVLLAGAATLGLGCAIRRLFSTQSGPQAQATLGRVGASLIILMAMASVADYPVRTPIFAAILAIAAIWVSRGLQSLPDGSLQGSGTDVSRLR